MCVSAPRLLRRPYAEGDKELIVVTILVAADGSFKVPTVDSRTSLKEALSMLGAVRWAPRCAMLRCPAVGRMELANSRGPGHSCYNSVPPFLLCPRREDDLLAVEVLWTPEEEVRETHSGTACIGCQNRRAACTWRLPHLPCRPPA